jgi:hypothetical protein
MEKIEIIREKIKELKAMCDWRQKQMEDDKLTLELLEKELKLLEDGGK